MLGMRGGTKRQRQKSAMGKQSLLCESQFMVPSELGVGHQCFALIESK